MIEDVEKYLDDIENKRCTQSSETKIKTLLDFQEKLEGLNIQPQQLNHFNERIVVACEEITNMKTTEVKFKAEKTQNGAASNKVAYNEESEDVAWDAADNSSVTFDSIVGNEKAIETIKEAVVYPVKYQCLYMKANVRPWRGVLLYGPPGTGKSLLARAAAGEAGNAFFNASCAELTSKWVGGSEKLMRSLFQSARENAPSIVFLDEIDSIGGSRGGEKSTADQRLTNQLLVEMDANINFGHKVTTLAATNLPFNLDTAVLRRLQKKIYIKLPTQEERAKIIKKNLGDSIQDTDAALLAMNSEYFSGADLENFCNDVLLDPLRMFLQATTFIYTEPNTDDEEPILEIFQTLPETGGNSEILHGTVDEILQNYSQDYVRLPKINTQTLIETLSQFKKNIVRPNIESFEKFNTGVTGIY